MHTTDSFTMILKSVTFTGHNHDPNTRLESLLYTQKKSPSHSEEVAQTGIGGA